MFFRFLDSSIVLKLCQLDVLGYCCLLFILRSLLMVCFWLFVVCVLSLTACTRHVFCLCQCWLGLYRWFFCAQSALKYSHVTYCCCCCRCCCRCCCCCCCCFHCCCCCCCCWCCLCLVGDILWQGFGWQVQYTDEFRKTTNNKCKEHG